MGYFLPRHLAWAETILNKNEYPDQHAADIAGTDLKHAFQQIRQVTVEPSRAPSIRRALANLEGPAVEFKQQWPDKNRVLSHAIAAFGPQGGTLLLGVDNRGVPLGLPFELTDLDEKDLAVRGAAKAVDPPVRVSTAWVLVDEALILDIEVHPSGEAIHYMDYEPWIRDGASTRRA